MKPTTVVNCFQNCIFIEDSQGGKHLNKEPLVVNCFQNCIFIEDSQVKDVSELEVNSCELLSELYFY